MTFTCDACGAQIEHSGPGHVPVGWAFRKIQGIVVTLCDSHAAHVSLYGDISAHLKDLLRERLDMKFDGEATT